LICASRVDIFSSRNATFCMTTHLFVDFDAEKAEVRR